MHLIAPSIMPAGTVMKDLSILKDTPDPIALPDSDYPAWLWTLTDESLASSQAGKKAAELDAEGGMALEDAKQGLKLGKTFDHKAERRKLRSRSVLG
jgi:large subunit ribosomal protein L54